MAIETLRPDGTSHNQFMTVVGAATAHDATSDDSDASYIRSHSSSVSFVDLPLTGGYTLLAGERVKRSRVRTRLRKVTSSAGGNVEARTQLEHPLLGEESASENSMFDSTSFFELTGGWRDEFWKKTADFFGAPITQQEIIDDLIVWVFGSPVLGNGTQVDFAEVWVQLDVWQRTDTPTVAAPSGVVTDDDTPTVEYSVPATNDGVPSTWSHQILVLEPGGDPDVDDPVWETLLTGQTSQPTETQSVPTGILPNGEYEAHVRIGKENVAGETLWSEWGSSAFEIDITPPEAPTLVVTVQEAAGRNRIDLIPGALTHGTLENIRVERVDDVDNGLVLDGTAGTHATTPDVNLLDADTAHQYQDAGTLVAGGETVSNGLVFDPDAFGETAHEFQRTGGTTGIMSALTQGLDFPIAGGVDVGLSIRVKASQDIESIGVFIDCKDSEDAQIAGGRRYAALKAVSAGEWTTIEGTVQTAEGTESIEIGVRVNSGDAEDGTTLRVDRLSLRLGTDPTFVPSRILLKDLDIRVRARIDGVTGHSRLVGPGWPPWQLVWNDGGFLELWLRDDSEANHFPGGAANTPSKSDGTMLWRATWDHAAKEVTFYESSDGETWSQRGDPFSVAEHTGTTSRSGGATLFVGPPADTLSAALYEAEIRDGIDGPVVARFDATAQDAGTDEFVDDQGNTWTLNGNATIEPAGPAPDAVWRTIRDGFLTDGIEAAVRSTLFDHDVPRAQATMYRARVVEGIVGGGAVAGPWATTDPIEHPNDGRVWLLDVPSFQHVTGGIIIGPTPPEVQIGEQIGVFRPLGRTDAVVVTAGLQGRDHAFEVLAHAQDTDAVEALLTHTGPLLLVWEDGTRQYLRVISRKYSREDAGDTRWRRWGIETVEVGSGIGVDG